MTRYTCPNPACPRRSPVTAAEPPTCYTCGGKMAATVDDARAQRTATCDVDRGIHVLGVDDATATTCQCGRKPVHVTDGCRALVAPIGSQAASATASALCSALLIVSDVSAVCLVEHTDAEFEVFVDGGEPDDIARCIYDNMPVYIALRGQESGGAGDGTRVRFSRGAMEAAVAHTPPRVQRCTFAGLGGAR